MGTVKFELSFLELLFLNFFMNSYIGGSYWFKNFGFPWTCKSWNSFCVHCQLSPRAKYIIIKSWIHMSLPRPESVTKTFNRCIPITSWRTVYSYKNSRILLLTAYPFIVFFVRRWSTLNFPIMCLFNSDL